MQKNEVLMSGRRYFLSLVLLLLLAVTSASLISAQENQALKIGVLLALTGPYPTQGNAFREGMELAVTEVNSTGGINGKQLELIIEDTKNDPKQALSAAQKLITHDNVIAALMSSYPEYRTGGMELQRQHVPVIAIWDSSPELDQMGDYIFGIGPWVPSSGEVSAHFAREKLMAKSAVIINSIDPWAELVSDYFEKTFTAKGGTILKRYAINPDTVDFRSVLLGAKVKNPDVIFSPIIDNIPTFYKQKRSVQLRAPAISTDVIAQDHIDKAPEALENVYQTKNKEPQLKGLVFARYKEKFGHAATMPWFVATAYDGIMILAQAMRKGNLTGSLIKDYLYTIKDFPGAASSYSFTAQGSAPQMAVMYQVRGGKFEYEWQP
jgi:branched-chain amino acid transport system substrate-binding protein